MSEAVGLVVLSSRERFLTFLSRSAMPLAALLLCLAFAATSPVFGTPANAVNILRQSASVLVLGLAMVLVVLVGGIDLSVGSVVLASATLAGIGLVGGLPPALAIGMGVGVGATVGLLNAVLIEVLAISPVVVTLGTMIAVRGLSLLALGWYNSWITIKAPVFDDLARRTAAGIPLDALFAICLALVIWVVLKQTVLGRSLHAIGDNASSARLAGLRVRRLRMVAYTGCGALAGVAGVMVAARTGLVSPSLGYGLEFFAIAVIALGAGGLPPGRVGVRDAIVGTLILMMIFNYMTIRGVPGTWQTTATGLLLLAATALGKVLQRDTADFALGIQTARRAVGASGIHARLARNGLLVAAVLVALFFAFLNPRFATLPNLVALVEQNAALSIVSVGATIGIISRVVDISPASVIVLGAVAAALGARHGLPMPIALALGIACCIGAYALNGLIVGGLRLDPLIVTLAAWIWARGLAVSLTGASTIPFDMDFVNFMSRPLVFGFTMATASVSLAFAAGWIILARSPLGMRVYALGGDPRMLRQAGVSDRRMRVVVFVLISLFTATAMLVTLGRLGAAAPTAGFGLELDAIVAVILGGASFQGGSGRLRDTAVGVVFLAVLNNGLSGLQIGDAQFLLIKGAAILATLILRALLQARFNDRALQ